MSLQENMEKQQSLTAEKLWPVVLALSEEQMKELSDFLMDYLNPWPEEKLAEVHKEVERGKVLSEAEFQDRFADYIK